MPKCWKAEMLKCRNTEMLKKGLLKQGKEREQAESWSDWWKYNWKTAGSNHMGGRKNNWNKVRKGGRQRAGRKDIWSKANKGSRRNHSLIEENIIERQAVITVGRKKGHLRQGNKIEQTESQWEEERIIKARQWNSWMVKLQNLTWNHKW